MRVVTIELCPMDRPVIPTVIVGYLQPSLAWKEASEEAVTNPKDSTKSNALLAAIHIRIAHAYEQWI